jgi:hypothetical protein
MSTASFIQSDLKWAFGLEPLMQASSYGLNWASNGGRPLSQASSPPHTVTLACCWRGVTRLLHPFRKVKSPSAEINGETTSRNSLRKEKWYKRNPEEMGIESPSILKQKLQQTNNSSKPPQANSMLALWPRTDTKPRTDNVLAILLCFSFPGRIFIGSTFKHVYNFFVH